MSEALIRFELPASFIESRAKLTPRELGYGYRNGWITDLDVVRLAMTDVVPETEPMEVVESLSLLLSDELGKVDDLVDRLVVDGRAVWVYLTVAWVYEHPSDFEGKPFLAIEKLYAEFDYPPEMEPFIPCLPPLTDGTPGFEGLEERLRDYLSESWQRYHEAR
ncbi:DUF2247 family protein [Nocardia sp. NPDC003482]